MAKTAEVTRRRMVLHLKVRGSETVGFFMLDEDGGVDSDEVRVRMPTKRWKELGQPEQLTVAIWPGDRQDIMESERFPS